MWKQQRQLFALCFNLHMIQRHIRTPNWKKLALSLLIVIILERTTVFRFVVFAFFINIDQFVFRGWLTENAAWILFYEPDQMFSPILGWPSLFAIAAIGYFVINGFTRLWRGSREASGA
jgi:hypothetical protein